jgi:four helix bundle protein
MKFDRFEDMIVWQKGQELTILGYKSLVNNKDYTFRNQFLGACISISNNIAEGFERKSNKEFKQFLFISKGSAGEVRSMLYLAKQLRYMDELGFNEMMNLCLSISKMLSALIKTL